MGFKENGPGCCDCGDPAECDGLTCSWTQSWDSVQEEITYYWTVTATSNTHKINSILVDGVQQLASGEEVYTKSGSIGPYARGSAVPASVVLSATNTCGNTCTNTLEPDCCVRSTASFLEVAGFRSSYDIECVGSYVDGFSGVTVTNTESVEYTGADGLNGTHSSSFSSSASLGSPPACWDNPEPTASGQLYSEDIVTTSDASYSRTVTNREYGSFKIIETFTGTSAALIFESTHYDFYWEENGVVIDSGTFYDPWTFYLGSLVLPEAECIAAGAFGATSQLIPPGFEGCAGEVAGTTVCTGEDGNTGASSGYKCYWDSGTLRRWVGN